ACRVLGSARAAAWELASRPAQPQLRMESLAVMQHSYILGYEPRTCLGAPRSCDAMQDRVAVAAVQGGEERACGRIGVECGREVWRDGCRAGAVVGGLPTAVLPGALDLGQAGLAHPAGRDQRIRLLPIDLRPSAARPAWRELLQPDRAIERALLPVDPAEAQCNVQRLRIADRANSASGPADLEPYAGRVRMEIGKPRLPVRGRAEAHSRQLRHRAPSPAEPPAARRAAPAGRS